MEYLITNQRRLFLLIFFFIQAKRFIPRSLILSSCCICERLMLLSTGCSTHHALNTSPVCPRREWHMYMFHYSDVIMGSMASQITGVSIVYSTVCSGPDKKPSSASPAYVGGIHRWPMNSPHKGSVTRKMPPFDYVIMLPVWIIDIWICMYACAFYTGLCIMPWKWDMLSQNCIVTPAFKYFTQLDLCLLTSKYIMMTDCYTYMHVAGCNKIKRADKVRVSQVAVFQHVTDIMHT